MKLSMSRFVLPILGLSMGALGFYHVQQRSQSAPLSAPPEAPARVPFDHSVAGSGVVEAESENITIGSALPGLVLEVHTPSSKVGQRVRAGDPLFRVDDRHLKAQLAVAEARLASATAALAKLEQQPRPEELAVSAAKLRAATAKAALWEDQYQRGKQLIDKGVIGQEEFVTRQLTYEAAANDKAQAQAEYDLIKAGAWKPDLLIAGASVKEAQAATEQLKTEIGRALVVAPVDGVVLQVNIRPGERISELDTKPLIVLGDTRTVHVRVDVDERDIPRFRLGAAARAYPRGDTSRELSLRFVRVEPMAVPKKALTGDNTERVDTRVLQVIYAIEPGQPPVYVGQQLDVFIRGGE
ncbi:MAG TPA: HlyD family efflux transporter periplasmic adaptor subunit [Gemmataceae bacterium]|nr:HlyD family efflux transporter periplasmic adaptor subunit [Gemmataceae bacterium]